MDHGVTVAWITAGSALVVALFGVLRSTLTARHTAQFAHDLEVFKHAQANASVSQAVHREELKASLSALSDSIESIQGIKDAIELLLFSVSGSLHREEALATISRSREAVYASYQQNLSLLSETEARYFHKAKRLALSVETTLKATVANTLSAGDGTMPDDNFALDTRTRRKIRRIRTDLTDCQQMLRDLRADRLMEQLLGMRDDPS